MCDPPICNEGCESVNILPETTQAFEGKHVLGRILRDVGIYVDPVPACLFLLSSMRLGNRVTKRSLDCAPVFQHL